MFCSWVWSPRAAAREALMRNSEHEKPADQVVRRLGRLKSGGRPSCADGYLCRMFSAVSSGFLS